MSSTNREVLEALRTAFPQLFTRRDEDGQAVDRLDLEKIRLLAGEGNYSDHYGLRWEDKPERFDAESQGKLPSLRHVDVKSIASPNTGAPAHVLIQGDNYHALKVLAYTHERSVDVIYIDPPYNTGNKDFKYNDRFVDKDDGYRHSKWLSFMAKRLTIAKTLLKDSGAIFLSIDGNEHAQLKLLCDHVFGESNQLADMVWHNSSRTNDFIAVEHEYILVYAKTGGRRAPWRTPRAEVAQLYGLVNALREKGSSRGDAEAALRKEIATLQRSAVDPRATKWLDNYRTLDDDWRIYYPVDLSGEGSGPPRTFAGVSTPAPAGRHWMGQDYIDELLSKGRIVWRGERAYRKLYLEESMDGLKSIVAIPGRQGTATLNEILGRDLFNNPKPVDLLSKLLRYFPNKSAVVLDFFAGSGSTAHAVMQLNAEDGAGGRRQCILVTNDEGEFKDDAGRVLPGGICTHVTYPRLKKVIEGYTTPKGKEVPGLGGGLEVFETAFVPVPKSRNQLQAFLRYSSALLQLKAGCFTPVESRPEWAIHTDGKKHLCVLFDDCAVEAAFERLCDIAGPVEVYVFAYDSDDDSVELFSKLPNVTVQEVPQPLLDLFFRIKG